MVQGSILYYIHKSERHIFYISISGNLTIWLSEIIVCIIATIIHLFLLTHSCWIYTCRLPSCSSGEALIDNLSVCQLHFSAWIWPLSCISNSRVLANASNFYSSNTAGSITQHGTKTLGLGLLCSNMSWLCHASVLTEWLYYVFPTVSLCLNCIHIDSCLW